MSELEVARHAPPDLEDKSKYVLVKGVPVFDENCRYRRRQKEDGTSEVVKECVDENQLKTLCDNTRVRSEKHIYGQVLIGHTDDDGKEEEQPRHIGWFKNDRMGVDPFSDRPVILQDWYIKKEDYNKEVLEEYPRRSPEVIGKLKENGFIDAVSILKRTPERHTLGLVTHATTEQVERFSDNCGTGAGGFKEGNTCANSGSEKEGELPKGYNRATDPRPEHLNLKGREKAEKKYQEFIKDGFLNSSAPSFPEHNKDQRDFLKRYTDKQLKSVFQSFCDIDSGLSGHTESFVSNYKGRRQLEEKVIFAYDQFLSEHVPSAHSGGESTSKFSLTEYNDKFSKIADSIIYNSTNKKENFSQDDSMCDGKKSCDCPDCKDKYSAADYKANPMSIDDKGNASENHGKECMCAACKEKYTAGMPTPLPTTSEVVEGTDSDELNESEKKIFKKLCGKIKLSADPEAQPSTMPESYAAGAAGMAGFASATNTSTPAMAGEDEKEKFRLATEEKESFRMKYEASLTEIERYRRNIDDLTKRAIAAETARDEYVEKYEMKDRERAIVQLESEGFMLGKPRTELLERFCIKKKSRADFDEWVADVRDHYRKAPSGEGFLTEQIQDNGGATLPEPDPRETDTPVRGRAAPELDQGKVDEVIRFSKDKSLEDDLRDVRNPIERATIVAERFREQALKNRKKA